MSESELKLWPWDHEDATPFFINPEGIEWWIDKETTEWAHRKDTHDISLKNIIGFILRKDGNPFVRLLMDKESNSVIYENTSLEPVAYFIDMLKANKLFDRKT